MNEEVIAQIHLPECERNLDARDGLAVRFAERMATDQSALDPAFKEELAAHFSAAEIVELGMMIGHYITWGRMLRLTGGDKGACEVFVIGDGQEE